MPLVWAHAEFVKLLASRIKGGIIDQPEATRKRYGGRIPPRRYVGWSFSIQRETMPPGFPVRLLLTAPATVHYGLANWDRPVDIATRDSGLGLHYVDLPTESLVPGQQVLFTFRWLNGRWEGRNFSIGIVQEGRATLQPDRGPGHEAS
ncbi:glucoamylase, (GLUCAN 1,4-ALPHA-GLUCOSIDASE) [mine drainage metagenome]